MLTKEYKEEHNGEHVRDPEIKGKKYCYRLQEEQEKPGKFAAEESPPVKEEEPNAEEGNQMIEGAEAMDSPENVKAEFLHEGFADDRGNTTEEVPPSFPGEQDEKDRNRDHSGQCRRAPTRSGRPRWSRIRYPARQQGDVQQG